MKMPKDRKELHEVLSTILGKKFSGADETIFNNLILPQINGPRERGTYKNQMILRQNYGGNWLAEVIERETGEIIARTITPRSLIGTGFAVFLVMKGYKE